MYIDYPALEVQQREGADPLYLLSAQASEILKWADAPRKKLQYMAGYQRELEDGRIDAIKEFLELDVLNILPSAVLIAVREGAFAVTKTASDGALVTIRIDLDVPSAPDLRKTLYEGLLERLDDDERGSIAKLGEVEQEADEALESEADDPEASQPPASYLAALTAELRDYKRLSPEKKAAIDEYVKSISKPGLILDGQHRVFGAKNAVGLRIRLPIVLLPGLSTQEQVFHFYVLNNKAKPLNKTQLRNIVSTSLSNKEIAALYDRFRIARLDVKEAQWTYVADTRDDSPFKGLISKGLAGESGRPLKDNVIDQVMRGFIRMPSRFRGLYDDVPDWAVGDQEYRLQLFFVMWSVVRDTYPKAWKAALNNEGQLFSKVALMTLQKLVLERLNGSLVFQPKTPLSGGAEFREAVIKALSGLSEDFFIKEWKRKNLDTNKGHQFVLDQMQKAISTNSKNLGNRELFRD